MLYKMNFSFDCYRLLSLILLLFPMASVQSTVTFSIKENRFEGVTGQLDLIQDAIRGAVTTDLVPKVEQLVSDKLGRYDFKPFLEGMGNANATALQGLRVDYASDPKVFVLGGGAGVGLNLEEFSPRQILNGDFFDIEDSQRIPNVGLGLAGNIMLGLNLGIFSPDSLDFMKDIDLYFNIFYLPLDIFAFEVNVFNIGLNAQYSLLESKSLLHGLFGWKGIRIGSGLNYYSSSLLVDKVKVGSTSANASVNVPEVDGNLQLKTTWDANISFGARVRTVVIPTDISTGIHLLYFLSLYVGLGADLIFGSSRLEVDNRASVTTRAPNLNDEVIHTASTDLTIEESSSPALFNLRTFAGLQIGIFAFKVFVQGTYETITNSYGVSFGTRIAY